MKRQKNTAVELFQCIETNFFDVEIGGYFEALTLQWQFMKDLRLNAKDANEKKSMNAHLHFLEACTTLYDTWPGV